MPSILIADDEVVHCMQLEEQLMTWGYEVATAHSGEAVVRLAMQTKPDLILLDILMPGSMNGIDAAKIILLNINTTIVFITGCEDSIWVDKAAQLFPSGFLYKPVSLTQLYAVIHIALKDRHLLASRPNNITPPPSCFINQKEMGIGDEEKSMLLNIQNLDHPSLFIEISENVSDTLQHEDVHILDSYLKEIILPMTRILSGTGIRLSPAEIKVAVLIRLGKSSKQISELLHLSIETINSHRKNIRKKLGITSSSYSLGTYLSSL